MSSVAKVEPVKKRVAAPEIVRLPRPAAKPTPPQTSPCRIELRVGGKIITIEDEF